MASCSYIAKNREGVELTGFQEYRKALGYTTARDVFIKAMSPTFQKDYSRYLEFDEQQVPTYESVMRVPYIKNYVGAAKIAASQQKRYPWIDNTRADYERLVDEANTFNVSSEYNDTLTAVVERSEKGDRLRVQIVPKNESNDSIAVNQYGVLKLNQRLSDIFSEAGVTVGALEEYESSATNGMVDFSKALDMANGFEGLIKIANNAEGVQALPEEFSHLLVGIFRNSPLVSRSLALLSSDNTLVKEILGDDYQSVVDSYEGVEGSDALVAEEALGRVLSDNLVKGVEDSNSSALNNLVRRLVKWIKGIFKNYDVNDVVKAREEVNSNMQRLGSDFLNGRKTITKEDIANSRRNARFNHLVEGVDNVLQIVQNALETERKRLKITSANDTHEIDKMNNRIASLKGYVNDIHKLNGLVTYAKWALSDLREANSQLDTVASMDSSVRFKVLRNIKTILESYAEFVKDFRKTLDQYEDSQIVVVNGEEINLADMWRSIDEQYQSSITRFEDEVLPAFMSFVAPFYDANPIKDKNGNIVPLERVFKTADKRDIDRGLILNEDVDTTYFDKWCTSMGTSSSIIAQFFDKAVKTARDKVRKSTMQDVRRIWELREKAEARGITTFEWMFEKNRDGKKTGYYISEYNYGQFEEDYQQLLDDLKKKYGENPFGEDYTKYNAERRAWLEQHAKSIFGKPIPNDTYLNKAYSKLSKAQKDTLEEFLDYKTSLEEGVPKNQVSRLKAIQRRRSGTQRVMNSISDPSKMFESIKEEAKSVFQHTADDDQIFGSVSSGLTDFTGKEYMTIPLLYTSKIQNPDELSTDVYSDLMAYAYSTSTYKELDKIVDPLEIGKQAIRQKKLLKTRGGKVIEETITVGGMKTKRPVYVEEEQNNLLWKVQKFLECQMYGRYLEPQGKVGKVDVQKATSFIMRFTSMAYLGCNYLAGIANVATAAGMQNIEAAAKEWFSAKNLASADKEYALMLPEFIAEIGARNKQSKLALFDELFDIKQDYRGKVGKTQKKNFMQRIFGTNLLFLQQGAGDHWIYNRTGIAMAKHYKVKYNGRKVSLWDVLEIVNTPGTNKKEMRVKEGVKNLDGTDFSAGHFSRTIARVNHTLVGTYNDEDQNAANRVAVGRLLQQMRKWILPQMMRRFESKRTILDLGKEEEGYYRTFWRFLGDVRRAEYNIISQWDSMTFEEKANVRRAVTELLQITSLFVLLQFISGGDKDPDRCWAAKFAEYMLNREVHELGFLAPTPLMASEAIKTVQSPFVVASALGDMAKVINVALVPRNWVDEVESGAYKGRTRVSAALLKAPIPPITYIKQINKIWEDLDAGTRFYAKDFR